MTKNATIQKCVFILKNLVWLGFILRRRARPWLELPLNLHQLWLEVEKPKLDPSSKKMQIRGESLQKTHGKLRFIVHLLLLRGFARAAFNS